jgi:hypothetical protein
MAARGTTEPPQAFISALLMVSPGTSSPISQYLSFVGGGRTRQGLTRPLGSLGRQGWWSSGRRCFLQMMPQYRALQRWRRNPKCGYGFFEASVAGPEQSNSNLTIAVTGRPSFSAGLNCIVLIAAAASFIFSSRRPFGDSVLKDSTLPRVSTTIVKTTSFVPVSRSFGVAASHTTGSAIPFLESCCPLCCAAASIEQTNKSNGRVALFMDSTLRRNSRTIP